MKYGFKNNIRVLYWVEQTTNSPWKLDVVDLISKTNDIISKSEKSKNPNVKLAYNLLVATGAISTNYLSLAKRWYEWSGRSWAEAIIKALENAEKWWVMEIVLYSEGTYKTMSLKAYEDQVSKDVRMLNGGEITKGLYDLYKAGSRSTFSKETWIKIWIYLKSRWIDWSITNGSKIITNLPTADIKSIISLWEQQIKVEKDKIDAIINPIVAKFGKDNPKLIEILGKNKDITFKDWVIDLTPILLKAKQKWENITDVIKVFQDATENFEKEAKAFDEISKESLKWTKWKNLKEIILWFFHRKKKDQNWKEIVVNTKPAEISLWENVHNKRVDTLSIQEIHTVLPQIQQTKIAISTDVNNPDKQKHIKELEELEKWLTARIKAKESKAKAAQSKDMVGVIGKEQKKWGNIDTLIQMTPKITKRLESVNAIAIDRSQLDDSLKWLEKYWIYDLKTAQEKLKELEHPKNEEEIKLKAEIIGYIKDNKNLAQKYIIAKKTLWNEAEAQELFIETNKYVGGKNSETYDFKALEKIATLTDPESSPGEKSLAKLESWQSLTMSKALEGEMTTPITNAPELNQVNISKNQDWTYNIPLFDAKGISKEQVEEYKESTKLYAELGLSQFIPHIPLINTELRKKWIDATIDGQVSTSEQQQILKAIYSKLFWKEIISSSLGEVERAFSSALWNPVNMKSAMQHSLSAHKLISWPGASIAPDTLQKWFRENTTPETTDPLKNLV